MRSGISGGNRILPGGVGYGDQVISRTRTHLALRPRASAAITARSWYRPSARARAWPRWALITLAGLAATLYLTGCLSPRYRHASKKTPHAVVLDRHFPPGPLESTLDTVIVSGGPGSWKRAAFWDEYVVTFHNAGDQPVQIAAVTLADFTGAARHPGDDPWKLQKESKSQAKRYKDAGMAFARAAAPRVLVPAAEPSVVAAAGVGTAGAAAAATATAVALPVYGATVLGINVHNKKAIHAEFKRRRLPLPIVLGAGETRAGSLFFPMVPDPRSLTVSWSQESTGTHPGEGGDSVLPLDFLRGLHVKGSRD